MRSVSGLAFFEFSAGEGVDSSASENAGGDKGVIGEVGTSRAKITIRNCG